MQNPLSHAQIAQSDSKCATCLANERLLCNQFITSFCRIYTERESTGTSKLSQFFWRFFRLRCKRASASSVRQFSEIISTGYHFYDKSKQRSEDNWPAHL
ncbi:unnamed protein product [Protopolystoma xenopodis]|uniref:Uncharacterized protein n=1 Tax=Protopolystoma xenopodis TaxID=117903 RepID=A0A3S4ZAZ0_9PLAT|nr:unnamed protein product [Protopolystoma xenopodis]